MKQIKSFSIKIVKKAASEYNKAFHAKLFTLFASSESELVQLAKDFPLHYEYCFCFLKNDYGQWYISNKSLEKVRNFVIKQAKNNPQNVIKYYNKWQKYWNRYQKLNISFFKDDFSKYGDKKLYTKFKAYYDLYLKVGGVAYICDSFMSSGETDWLQELLKKELQINYGAEAIRIVGDLVSPVHLSFVLAEEFDLLKIASLLEKKCGNKVPELKDLGGLLLRKMQQHSNKYYWIKNNYYNVEDYNLSEVYNKVKEIIIDCQNKNLTVGTVLRKRQDELKIQSVARHKFIKNIKLSRSNKNIIVIANLFSKWKDVRKSGVYMGMGIFDKFFEEISRRTSYTKEELTFVVFSEIEGILLKSVDLHTEIKARKGQIFFAVKPNGEYVLIGGTDAKKYFSLILRKNNNNIVFRGVPACRGEAEGRVHIILKTNEMSKFEDGEILIMNNTTPEFVSIMKKAAAIITEQGGITSHAAVVSRELGKPCIIGVKGIASVLKNGQMLRVDANHGLISLI